ncbi:MAG: hypothetical protein WCF92_01065 [bacterium]
MNIITRIKINFFNILTLLRETLEDFLFYKSEIAIRLEKYLNEDWLFFYSPLEKNNVLSFFSYENTETREAIREIKYSRNQKILNSLAQFCGETLASYIEENIDLFGADEIKRVKIIFIPIPSHKKRQNEKGWNQADDIVIAIQKNFPFESKVEKNILIKVKNTPHQTNLHRTERLSNLTNAFSAKIPSEFLHSFFILVDDVTTTGSTLEEARKVLKRAGARHVICFSLARSGE